MLRKVYIHAHALAMHTLCTDYVHPNSLDCVCIEPDGSVSATNGKQLLHICAPPIDPKDNRLDDLPLHAERFGIPAKEAKRVHAQLKKILPRSYRELRKEVTQLALEAVEIVIDDTNDTATFRGVYAYAYIKSPQPIIAQVKLAYFNYPNIRKTVASYTPYFTTETGTNEFRYSLPFVEFVNTWTACLGTDNPDCFSMFSRTVEEKALLFYTLCAPPCMIGVVMNTPCNSNQYANKPWQEILETYKKAP